MVDLQVRKPLWSLRFLGITLFAVPVDHQDCIMVDAHGQGWAERRRRPLVVDTSTLLLLPAP